MNLPLIYLIIPGIFWLIRVQNFIRFGQEYDELMHYTEVGALLFAK